MMFLFYLIFIIPAFRPYLPAGEGRLTVELGGNLLIDV